MFQGYVSQLITSKSSQLSRNQYQKQSTKKSPSNFYIEKDRPSYQLNDQLKNIKAQYSKLQKENATLKKEGEQYKIKINQITKNSKDIPEKKLRDELQKLQEKHAKALEQRQVHFIDLGKKFEMQVKKLEMQVRNAKQVIKTKDQEILKYRFFYTEHQALRKQVDKAKDLQTSSQQLLARSRKEAEALQLQNDFNLSKISQLKKQLVEAKHAKMNHIPQRMEENQHQQQNYLIQQYQAQNLHLREQLAAKKTQLRDLRALCQMAVQIDVDNMTPRKVKQVLEKIRQVYSAYLPDFENEIELQVSGSISSIAKSILRGMEQSNSL